MLTKLPNGVHIRLADVRSIKVEQRPGREGSWETTWDVEIRHGDSFDVSIESVPFDSLDAAREYADRIAGLASAEQVEEASRSIEKDARRERDRVLDRLALLAAGYASHGESAGMAVELAKHTLNRLDEAAESSGL